MAVGADDFNDTQTGQDGPLRVVFMGQGRAEKGQDAVAHQPRHRALVAIDRGDHVLERAVDDLGPLLRVQVAGRGGGSFHVAEQHGDDPPLADHSIAAAGSFQFRIRWRGEARNGDSVTAAYRRRVNASAAGAVDAGVPSGWPQLKQNFAPGGRLVPQLAQAAGIAAPQLKQNFAPAGFLVWQFGQFMDLFPHVRVAFVCCC